MPGLNLIEILDLIYVGNGNQLFVNCEIRFDF